MNAYTPLPDAPPVERELAADMFKRGLKVAPLLIAVGALADGVDGAASVAYGVAIVLLNLLLSALMLGWAAKKTASVLMMTALGGFFVRMGIVTLAILLVRHQDWVALVPMSIAVLVASLGLLFWETRYVSASLAFPGLKPSGKGA
jgi:hypothetical protein